MAGSNQTDVVCCFCGESEAELNAIRLLISAHEMDEELQTLFAHKACLGAAVHVSVPLHPAVFLPK
jgi:hypothetical protein